MTTALPADPALARFSMVLPNTWTLMDLDPATRDRSVERLIRQALGTRDSLATLRRWAITQYRAFLQDATAAGAFFAAQLSQDIGGRPLTASMLAFLGLTPLGADRMPMGVEEMVTTPAEPGEDESIGEGPPEVELPIGWAVRVRGRTSAGLAGSDGVVALADITRFFVPVAEWGYMLVMAFSTPILSASDTFAALFDQLARTARWQV